MEEKKLGGLKKFKHKNGKILVGTIDKKNCTAAYVRLETWITVTESLESSIAAIRRRIIANKYQLSDLYFDELKSTIIDYQYNLTKDYDIAFKKSFISIDITLLSNSKFNFDDDFIFSCYNFGDSIFDLLETLSQHFDMSPSKK